MANPQLENGYVRIATEILEAFAKTRIPGEARQVLDFILRKTWGWGKVEDAISLSQFNLATNINKPNIIRALRILEESNIIIKKDNGKLNIYRFNKDYTSWKPLSKKITLSKKIMSVIEKDNPSLSKKITQITIDTTTIDTITIDTATALYPLLSDPTIKPLWEEWKKIRLHKGKNYAGSLRASGEELQRWGKHKAEWVLRQAIKNEWASLVDKDYKEPKEKDPMDINGGKGWL